MHTIKICLQDNVITGGIRFKNINMDLSKNCIQAYSYDRFCYSAYFLYESYTSARSSLIETLKKHNVIQSEADFNNAEDFKNIYEFEDYRIAICKNEII